MMASKKSIYKDPTPYVAALVERRNEIIDQAPLHSTALGVDEMDVIMALAQCDSVERARGDAEKAELLYELEMDHINHEIGCCETESCFKALAQIVKDAADEYLSDPDSYNMSVAASLSGHAGTVP